VLVGDIDQTEAKKLAEQYFGSWKGGASGAVPVPPPPPMQPTHVVIVDKPGAPQTALMTFGLGSRRTPPTSR